MSPSLTPDPERAPNDDSTLGGYFAVHSRPPAYTGPDGHPYTDLVFPRWAQTGVGIVGHVETPTLVESASHDEAIQRLGELTLLEVQELLAEAIARDASEWAE